MSGLTGGVLYHPVILMSRSPPSISRLRVEVLCLFVMGFYPLIFKNLDGSNFLQRCSLPELDDWGILGILRNFSDHICHTIFFESRSVSPSDDDFEYGISPYNSVLMCNKMGHLRTVIADPPAHWCNGMNGNGVSQWGSLLCRQYSSLPLHHTGILQTEFGFSIRQNMGVMDELFHQINILKTTGTLSPAQRYTEIIQRGKQMLLNRLAILPSSSEHCQICRVVKMLCIQLGNETSLSDHLRIHGAMFTEFSYKVDSLISSIQQLLSNMLANRGLADDEHLWVLVDEVMSVIGNLAKKLSGNLTENPSASMLVGGFISDLVMQKFNLMLGNLVPPLPVLSAEPSAEAVVPDATHFVRMFQGYVPAVALNAVRALMSRLGQAMQLIWVTAVEIGAHCKLAFNFVRRFSPLGTLLPEIQVHPGQNIDFLVWAWVIGVQFLLVQTNTIDQASLQSVSHLTSHLMAATRYLPFALGILSVLPWGISEEQSLIAANGAFYGAVVGILWFAVAPLSLSYAICLIASLIALSIWLCLK